MANTNSLTKPYTGNLAGFTLNSLLSNTVKVCLLSSAYVPSMAHLNYTDLTEELPTANGYTIGGLTLTGKSITGNIFKADNPSWVATGTLVAFYWVLYDDSGTKPLIAYGELNNNSGSPLNVTTLIGDSLTMFVSSIGFLSVIAINGSL